MLIKHKTMRLIDFKDFYKDEATCKTEFKNLRDKNDLNHVKELTIFNLDQ